MNNNNIQNTPSILNNIQNTPSILNNIQNTQQGGDDLPGHRAPSILNNSDKKKIKSNFKNNYWKVILNILLIGILILASINWSLSLYNFNFVEFINNYINKLFKINLPINKIIYILIGLIALYIAFKRETWLPFLGKTILPDIFVPLNIPTNYNKIITIKTKPNKKIIYWAALHNEEKLDVSLAYDNYSNSGCVLSNDLGEAQLYIIEGTS